RSYSCTLCITAFFGVCASLLDASAAAIVDSIGGARRPRFTRRRDKPSETSNGRRDQAIRDNEVERAEARSETVELEELTIGFRRGAGVAHLLRVIHVRVKARACTGNHS